MKIMIESIFLFNFEYYYWLFIYLFFDHNQCNNNIL